ncbi:MAG TPA: type I phosphomannose isomerase catalytic subunit [Terracidiphilus sp.]|nr:type I phosphomannose isomerase catalytic subunit [Terracidiphilus sp.]
MNSTQAVNSAALAPFLIEPRFVARVWGYHSLRPWFDFASGETIGEVWLTGDDCTVATGAHAGESLSSLFRRYPQAFPGTDAGSGSPLLVKVLFAREKLSVQVHPDDLMAQKYGEPRGKTECWYVLAAEPGSQVAVGLRPGVTLDQVRAGIRDGTLEKSLHAIEIKRGDMVFVAAGTVHAIWPGSILLEVQQNSDLTYRMYDYGRPRELHVEKSLEAVRLDAQAGRMEPKVLPDRTVLIEADYFSVERIAMAEERSSATLRGEHEPEAGLSYLFAASGSASILGSSFGPLKLRTNAIVGIPASAPDFTVRNQGGLELIRISPRRPLST